MTLHHLVALAGQEGAEACPARLLVAPWLLAGVVGTLVVCSPAEPMPGELSGPVRGVEVHRPGPEERAVGGKDFALLVATNEYDHWGHLDNPISDIEAIGEDLREVYGFSVESLENPTRRELRVKLREYADQKDFGPRDQLLIFIAGHGLYDSLTETGYLVTRDSSSIRDDPAYDTFLSYPSILRLIDKIPAQHILLVADACDAGTLDPRIAVRGAEIFNYSSNAAYLRRKLELRTRRYVTSGGKDYVFDGVSGEHSPFARAVLEGLRSFGGSDGILTLDELIADHLETLLPLPRWGEFGDNDPGSTFLFVVKGRRAAPIDILLPEDVGDAISYCDAGGGRNMERGVRIFRDHLEKLPPDEVARLDQTLLARAQRESLEGSTERACWLYKALFSGLYSSRETLYRQGDPS